MFDSLITTIDYRLTPSLCSFCFVRRWHRYTQQSPSYNIFGRSVTFLFCDSIANNFKIENPFILLIYLFFYNFENSAQNVW